MERVVWQDVERPEIVPVDWLAIEALVAVLYEQSDARVFELFNKMIERDHALPDA